MMSRGSIVAQALVLLLIGVACAGGNSQGGAVSPAPGPGGALTACQALEAAERYRYSFDLTIFSPEPETPLDETQVGLPPFALLPNNPTFEFPQAHDGLVVNPDSIQIVIKNQDEGQPALELIYIGQETWSKVGSQWVASGTGTVPLPFPPGRVCNAIMSAPDLGGVLPVEEELNGMATRHYRLDRVDADTASALLGPASDMGRLLQVYEMDVWLTEDGWPARLEISSEGTYPSGRKLFMELTLEIRDLNKDDINIEPPI